MNAMGLVPRCSNCYLFLLSLENLGAQWLGGLRGQKGSFNTVGSGLLGRIRTLLYMFIVTPVKAMEFCGWILCDAFTLSFTMSEWPTMCWVLCLELEVKL